MALVAFVAVEMSAADLCSGHGTPNRFACDCDAGWSGQTFYEWEPVHCSRMAEVPKAVGKKCISNCNQKNRYNRKYEDAAGYEVTINRAYHDGGFDWKGPYWGTVRVCGKKR